MIFIIVVVINFYICKVWGELSLNIASQHAPVVCH